ncbi:hypothetical protein GCM10011371_33340 [Novosphingobium marinum]|uniref:Uncharacterized protein n=1 Tax=Novosphingobium marinum TaxID=1514948 RepID=A0A7Y9XYQ3_9SPHN|nr:hypothetical protein [Novosphingobium marinum]NYH97059.1 hypothetical protein [Novosphingobium marinum]GGC43198.1 hypothetical protein GCM10011371_33340 [Novosphingobium marinum]
MPVTEGDITDRPYRVIGTIVSSIRKATIFSRGVSHDKVYRELWERGEKMGADAVILAEYGESKRTAFSPGSREIRGKAIKFLTDEEVAALRR